MSDEVVSSEAQPARSAPRDGARSDGPRGAAGGQRRERKPGGAAGGDRRAGGGANRRRKFCRFCAEKELVLDYKDPELLGQFITERYKIVPARVTGACAKHQRALTTAIKRARMIALLPFTTLHND